jgi:hypothetical protein
MTYPQRTNGYWEGSVSIHDLNRLRKLAGFQGGYLN